MRNRTTTAWLLTTGLSLFHSSLYAGVDYQSDGVTISATTRGARLRCVFQRLEGEATCEGLWMSSTVTNSVNDRFRVVAVALGRQAARAAIVLPIAVIPRKILPIGCHHYKDAIAGRSSL